MRGHITIVYTLTKGGYIKMNMTEYFRQAFEKEPMISTKTRLEEEATDIFLRNWQPHVRSI